MARSAHRFEPLTVEYQCLELLIFLDRQAFRLADLGLQQDFQALHRLVLSFQYYVKYQPLDQLDNQYVAFGLILNVQQYCLAPTE